MILQLKITKLGKFNANNPVPNQIYDVDKIVLPPATYRHEKAKFEERLPAAQQFARDHKINELFQGKGGSFGIITQGGTHTVLLRALRRLEKPQTPMGIQISPSSASTSFIR